MRLIRCAYSVGLGLAMTMTPAWGTGICPRPHSARPYVPSCQDRLMIPPPPGMGYPGAPAPGLAPTPDMPSPYSPAGDLGMAMAPESFNPNMLGDHLGFGARIPTPRSFKIAENESPLPQDRVYFGFNFFEKANKAVNTRFGTHIGDTRVYRETLGLEKTFLAGDTSLGVRMPLNTIHAEAFNGENSSTHTEIGDVSVILKCALWQADDCGHLLTVGLAVTFPTGPDTLAGDVSDPDYRSTVFQPFGGFIYDIGWDLFIHGFSALDIPTDEDEVILLFNDIGFGYWIYRDCDCDRCVTGIVPTIEVHVTTPLEHRGALNFNDPLGTSDIVNLTSGVTFELFGSSTAAVGLVTPVTGPRPFEYEILFQLNCRF